MASLSFSTVDAFSSVPFGGNPAAVIVFPKADARSEDVQLMQNLAAEFNLAETSFLLQREDSTVQEPHYLIRWFTPAVGRFICASQAPSPLVC
jgi:PhzF family phenazine biosynthesis protein